DLTDELAVEVESLVLVHRDGKRRLCGLSGACVRQVHGNGLGHDVAGRDHQDDEQDQHHVHQRGDVDARDHVVLIFLSGCHETHSAPDAAYKCASTSRPSALARDRRTRIMRWKKLKAATAGSATSRPIAVAISASPISAISPELSRPAEASSC